ncbi:class I SAM-dependent methyltransferase [Desulfitobacterium chlororespirans]|uniref:Ubiquinone/menaquinone biosynthesis C-methylase UbiE n=1 Tax=Desulfitobacterium chlororespirans DSM 11544 TaxID=1121395 RepID=A0A1M7SKR4_9FIRM|nr:class I SAM-dependent methyltransferase [Desulfitobacterium chlororespirans]SHN59016.1 Ubiquinone/menaquinone biosynthesis C-methylase UbiE [Desulfitobacterium chlororespirans DSM 11544]
MTSILFDVFYRSYDNFMKTFRLDDHEAVLSQIRALTAKGRPGQPEPLKIADIGGGTGVLAHSLLELGHDVTIIDPAQRMTAIAKERNLRVTVINETLAKVSPEPLYDVIILRDCFHHIADQEPALSKLSQILQDDGLLIIQDFSPGSLRAQLLFTLERCLLEKIYPIPSATLAAMMVQAGFNSTIVRLNSRDYLVTGTKEKPAEVEL